MRRPGIEPGPPPWQGGIIPFSHAMHKEKLAMQ